MKKAKKTKKNEKTVIHIKAKEQFKLGKAVIYNIYDECLAYQSENFGKRLPSDFITLNKKGIVKHAFISKDGKLNVTAHVTIRDLEELVKLAKSRAKYFNESDKKRKAKGLKCFNNFFVHLNPEISFLVKYLED